MSVKMILLPVFVHVAFVFVLLALVFVALRILCAVGLGHPDRSAGRNALVVGSAIVLAIMWLIYALRLLLALR
jgi:hypothetical protein